MYKAQLYGKSNLTTKNITKRALEEFGSKLNWKPNASIVDIGPGPGNILVEQILPQIPNYKEAVGIDISQEMVHIATKEYSKVPNLKFIHGDILEGGTLNFKNHFDYATSMFCLMLIPEQKTALRNICELVKPGGKFFAILPTESLVYEPLKALLKDEKWKKYLNHDFVSPYSGLANPRVRMGNYLKAAGFSRSEVVLRENCDFYEDENEFKDFVRSIAITNGTMPEEMKEDFYGEFFEGIKEDGYFKNGGCDFPSITMTVFATK